MKEKLIVRLREKCNADTLYGVDFERRDICMAVADCLNEGLSVEEVNAILQDEAMAEKDHPLMGSIDGMLESNQIATNGTEWSAWHWSLNNGYPPFESQEE